MIDNSKIEQAVRLMLEGIGEDPEREGLRETPARIARMCAELYKGMEEDAQTHLSGKRISPISLTEGSWG